MEGTINLNIPVNVPMSYPLETLKKQVTEYVKYLVAKTHPDAKDEMSIFNSISGAWDDGVSVEEETKRIRAARTSNLTRQIEDL